MKKLEGYWLTTNLREIGLTPSLISYHEIEGYLEKGYKEGPVRIWRDEAIQRFAEVCRNHSAPSMNEIARRYDNYVATVETF